MSARKEYSMMFQIQAQMSGTFNSTFTKAQQAVASTQKEIVALGKTQSDISAFQKQQGAVEGTKKKLETLQQQYDNIQREIQETEGFSSSLENKLLSKQQQIDRTTASLDRQTQKLDEMERELQEAGVDTQNLTGESTRLEKEMDDLKRKQEEVADGTGKFGAEGSAAFASVGDAIAAAGITVALKEITAAYMECVTIAGDFEEAMSTVVALSGASADEMVALSEKAKELGATTKFTAKEAADAMGYMGMAGWDASQMIQGMDGVLQLAAASGEDLAMVSDIVTDNLTAFGLKASDTARFADVLAAAATNSNTSVSVMGETFKASASIAGALGFSVEDVATAVGLMANAGVKGSTAGTALKNTFNGLLEGATFTAQAFGEYEFSAVKADGTMKTFMETMEELRDVFADMTEAERVNNAMLLAGKRGYNGLLAIINATEEDFSKLALSIDNSTGAAQRMASVKLDNMNGQLTIMKSAWDGLKIAVGEQFTPVMQDLYKILADILGGITSFIKERPQLVKAIAAFVGIVGAVVAGLTAYSVAAKVAAAASALLSASIPGLNIIIGVTVAIAGLTAACIALGDGMNEAEREYRSLTATSREQYDHMVELQEQYEEACDAMGETSAEAQLLKADLDDATVAYENNKQTAEQMAEAHRELIDAYNEEVKAYQDTVTGIENEGVGAMNLVAKLENLVNAEDKSVETKGKIYTMVRLLNNAVPQLGLAYDEMTDSLNMTADGIRAVIQAQINREKNEANYEELKKQIAKEGELKAELDRQRIETEARRKEYEDAKAASDAAAARRPAAPTGEVAARSWAAQYSGEIQSYTNSINRAEEALRSAEAAEAEAQTAYDTNQGMIESLTNSVMGYGDANTEVEKSINITMTAVAALTEQYNKAYAAAYESVTGQYDLWDKADKVVATSVGNINANLESQTKYWADYNSNLELLRSRTADIEGLQEVIASFADGSKESVNAVAGMAAALERGDTKSLENMVANYRALNEAQSAVSESIADLKTNYTNEMQELTESLAGEIEKLDFSSDAATAAKATLQGYIDAAVAMTPSVRAAYAALGDAASQALRTHTNASYSGSYFDIPGHYASGTSRTQEGPAVVGEHGPELVYMKGGETVLNARETSAVLSKPGGGGGTTNISLSPVYTINGSANPEELEAVLRAHDEGLRDIVLEIVEGAGADAARRAYA